MKESFFENKTQVKRRSESVFQPSDLSIAIAMEAERLANKYNKDSFECEDLQMILRVGRDNIRTLMNDKSFPAIEIGNRKIVPAIALAGWMLGATKNEY